MKTYPISSSNQYFTQNNNGIVLTQGNTATGSFNGFTVMSSTSVGSATPILAAVTSMSFESGNSVSGSLFFDIGTTIDIGLTRVVLSGSSAPILLYN